jgi:hypothetical protein
MDVKMARLINIKIRINYKMKKAIYLVSAESGRRGFSPCLRASPQRCLHIYAE